MKARYLIRPKADQDIQDQAIYLAAHSGSHVGHRFLVAAHHTFNLLAGQPRIGWQFTLRSTELSSVRVFTVSGFKKWVIIYRVRDEAVEIPRVVHGSRDLLALLSREGLE